jgi:hypothetical protein
MSYRSHRFAVAFSIALFSLVLASCDDSSSGAPDAAGGGDGGSKGGAHALCASSADAGPTFPDDFEKSCGMGSNKPLCVGTSSSSCSSGLCLWHQTSPGKRAYCTVACDPQDAASCPPRFTCQVQGCSDGPTHVCARAEAEPEPACSTSDELLADRGLSIRAIGGLGERLYLAGFATKSPSKLVVLSRKQNESAWQLIYEGEVAGTLDWRVMRAGEALYFQSFSGAQQRLLRVVGETVEPDPLPECVGDPNECVVRLAIFATPDGKLRAIGRTRSTSERRLLERGAAGWTTLRALTEKPQQMAAFAVHGFYARCPGADTASPAALCVSDDGERLEQLELPVGATLPPTLTLLGDHAGDFYWVGEQRLWHRVGGTWFEEGPPAAKGQLRRAVDRTLYFYAANTLYRLDGGCWQTLPSSRDLVGLLPSGGRRFLRIDSSSKLCEVTLD